MAASTWGGWWITDRLGVAGIVDRAAAGWLVVIPTWLAVPVVAGWTWARLDRATRRLAAGVLAIAIAVVPSILLIGEYLGIKCGYGVPTVRAGVIAGAIAVGVCLGGASAIGGFAAARELAAGSRLRAIVVAASIQVLGAILAGGAITWSFLASMGTCPRP
jgi:hypothetical protein